MLGRSSLILLIMPQYVRRIFSVLPAAVLTLQSFPVMAQIINQQSAATNGDSQQEEEGTIPGLYYDPSGELAPTFASNAASDESGSIRLPADSQAPSYLNGAWPANASTDQVLKIGHLKDHPQFKQFTQKNINQILEASGKDPATVSLAEVPIASSITLEQYLEINPEAADQSLEEAPPVVQSAFGYYEDEPLLNEPINEADITFIEQKSSNPELSGIPVEDLLEGDWGEAFTREDQGELAETLSKVNSRLGKLPLKQLAPIAQGIVSGDWDTVKKQAKDLAVKEGSQVLIKELMKNPQIATAIKDLPLGTLPLDKLGLADAPGVGETAIEDIPGSEDKTLNQIPGLKDVPLDQIDLALALSFTRFDLLGRIDTTDAAAVVDDIDRVISGGTKDQIPRPEPCKIDGSDTKNCRHFELDNVDGGGEPTKLSGMGWIQGPDQKVEGGKGWLRVVANGKEVTGIKPWIAGYVKLYLEDMKEGTGGEVGSARLSTAWQYCYTDTVTGLHCTPHFVRIPTPYRIKEGGIMLLLARSGGIPDMIRDLQPNQQQFCSNPQIAEALDTTASSSPDGGTKYGHHPFKETSEDLYQVPSLEGAEVGLNKDAAEKFEQLSNDAAKQGLDIKAASGFRSVNDQQEIWDAKVASSSPEEVAKVSAPPGHSEHHTGYTVDIATNANPTLTRDFESTPEFQWLQENAAKYGYEMSFPRNNSQGVSYEPWHWKYTGSKKAQQVFAKTKKQNSTLLASAGATDSHDRGDDHNSEPGNPQKNIAQYLARIAKGESSGGINTGSNPETGATGEYQFIPETRQTILNNHGYDAWSSDKNERDQAVLALIRDYGNQGNVNEDIIGHIEKGDFARADQLLGQHVRDANGKVIRYGQFTSLPGGAEAHSDWSDPTLLEKYGPDGDAGTNAPIAGNSIGGPCATASNGGVIGPEGDGVSTGRLSSPTPGAIVTSEYGPRVPPAPGASSFHAAIDLAMPTGTPILAADGGIVEYSGPKGGYGNYILVNHGNGLATWYAHNQANGVRVGQKVTSGQKIGTVGSTGISTGPHVDFGVIEGYKAGNIDSGQAVNPRKHVRF